MLTLLTKDSKHWEIRSAEGLDECSDATDLAEMLVMETGLEMLIPFNREDCYTFACDALVNKNKCLLVAVDNRTGEIVGFLCGGIAPSFYNNKVKQSVEFGWFVRPEYRESGIGHDLHKAYEEWATSQGVAVVGMMHMGSGHVGKMYEKMGYTPREYSYTKKVN